MSEPGNCFKQVEYKLSNLLQYLDIGDIALPDIQRPFVWSNTKVRDLFDSMYRGFPVGYFLFWENLHDDRARQIGLGEKQHESSRLIIDGQQRLTSLYAVFRGKQVLDENYRERNIEIAFRPRDGRFDVANAPIRRDPEWISNISEILNSDQSNYRDVRSFLERLKRKSAVSEEEEEQISHNFDRLFDLQNYPFVAMEIAESVDEEQVANIFVRINSEGAQLNQGDFILTLLSVFWEEGRAELEQFCQKASNLPTSGATPSPFNHFIKPAPDQLLRVAVSLGFFRGRLKSAYQLLRGKDMDTGLVSKDQRDKQFKILQKAQSDVLNLNYWHRFLDTLTGAGFRGSEMISSQNTLLYSYAFYLLGRTLCNVPEHKLQKIIGRWFFFASLTGRYTNSPESVMDGDLNRIHGIKSPEQFIAILDELMANELTNDYWKISLPAELNSSSARNPKLFAFVASQNRLNAPVLFSHQKIADLIDPALHTSRKTLERHHLFPRAWLEKNNIRDLKLINQMANYALLEWPENIAISDDSPTNYVAKIKARFESKMWDQMQELHALPGGWANMEYEAFLSHRRGLMAEIIRRGYESLK